MFDLIIKNATIINGSGRPGYRGDVGVRKGKIISVGQVEGEAAETVDANGYALAPGFIDVHAHGDLFAHVDPLCASKLRQGITTEISGQCGLGPAPVRFETLPVYKSYYEKQGAPLHPRAETFTSYFTYFNEVAQQQRGIHMALFAPHGTLRIAAMGFSPAAPDGAQLSAMRALLEQAMQAGALGLSTGLMYAPGSFSQSEELISLCEVAAEFGGIYTSHLRNQGEYLVESVEEALLMGERTGVGVNISHHKAAGKSNWGKVRETTALLNRARERGIIATHDVYPYAASSTTLSATLPPSCMKEGIETLLVRLSDAAYVKELEQRIFEPAEVWENSLLDCGYDGILIFRAPATPAAEGKSIAQFAKECSITPFDAYIRLLRENKLAVGDICFSMAQEDVDYLAADPFCMFGTDALYVEGMKNTHPRAIGTFPRILGRCVRENRLLPLEEAVRKMTSLAADTYKLRGKGRIAAGYDADLTLFDPEHIIDHADYTDPLAPNEGIVRVYVGGKLALRDGEPTGCMNGQIIKRA